jgi:hypothetical protein
MKLQIHIDDKNDFMVLKNHCLLHYSTEPLWHSQPLLCNNLHYTEPLRLSQPLQSSLELQKPYIIYIKFISYTTLGIKISS